MEEIMRRIDSNDYILDLNNISDKEKNKTIKIPFHRRIARCEFCGAKYLLVNKARHEPTIKHFDGKYISTERFEMT